jgi:hypothetical protein
LRFAGCVNGKYLSGFRVHLAPDLSRADAFLHYTRPVDPMRVRLIAMHPDTIVGFGDTRIHTETATFEVLASEVANPTPNDQLIVDVTFVVQGEPERRDPDRLVWSLDTRPA